MLFYYFCNKDLNTSDIFQKCCFYFWPTVPQSTLSVLNDYLLHVYTCSFNVLSSYWLTQDLHCDISHDSNNLTKCKSKKIQMYLPELFNKMKYLSSFSSTLVCQICWTHCKSLNVIVYIDWQAVICHWYCLSKNILSRDLMSHGFAHGKFGKLLLKRAIVIINFNWLEIYFCKPYIIKLMLTHL